MSKTSHDSETPARGQQVITACALIHHNIDGVEKVLVAKRAATKKFLPGVFELPGGHINWGEDIVEGLKREVREELGAHINVGDPYAAFTYTNEIKGSHSIEVVYFARCIDPIEKITLQPDNHSEFKWVSQEETATIGPTSDEELRSVIRDLAILNGQSISLGM